jgi:hypothetical protein
MTPLKLCHVEKINLDSCVACRGVERAQILYFSEKYVFFVWGDTYLTCNCTWGLFLFEFFVPTSYTQWEAVRVLRSTHFSIPRGGCERERISACWIFQSFRGPRRHNLTEVQEDFLQGWVSDFDRHHGCCFAQREGVAGRQKDDCVL